MNIIRSNKHLLKTLATVCLIGGFFLASGITGCANVKLKMIADKQLNWYNGEPHTMDLRIFQMDNKEAFEMAGNWKQLCGGNYDEGQFLNKPVTEKSIRPGSKQGKKIRREKGAKYLGIVACYYDPKGYPPKTSTVLALPWRYARFYRLNIHLGKNEIDHVTQKGPLWLEKKLTDANTRR